MQATCREEMQVKDKPNANSKGPKLQTALAHWPIKNDQIIPVVYVQGRISLLNCMCMQADTDFPRCIEIAVRRSL